MFHGSSIYRKPAKRSPEYWVMIAMIFIAIAAIMFVFDLTGIPLAH